MGALCVLFSGYQINFHPQWDRLQLLSRQALNKRYFAERYIKKTQPIVLSFVHYYLRTIQVKMSLIMFVPETICSFFGQKTYMLFLTYDRSLSNCLKLQQTPKGTNNSVWSSDGQGSVLGNQLTFAAIFAASHSQATTIHGFSKTRVYILFLAKQKTKKSQHPNKWFFEQPHYTTIAFV